MVRVRPAVQGSERARQEHAELEQRRRQFRALTATTRARLTAIYAKNEAGWRRPASQTRYESCSNERIPHKLRCIAGELGWARGLRRRAAGANNAAFGAQAAYDELVPAFEGRLVRALASGGRAFYDAVRQLAEMPKAQRTRELKRIQSENING